MPEAQHLFIVAGDPSGDRHAAGLAADLKTRIRSLTITALGGPHLQKTANHFLFNLVALGGFGFWEPILKLPALFRAKRMAIHTFEVNPPSMVILVDYYGFNIHIARAAHRLHIPVLYYISPQVWASRPHRIEQLKRVIRRMLVLFPFEKTIYEKAGVPVTGVMHPLLQKLPAPGDALPAETTIGLLPGSRPSVIRRHLPILEETAERLKQSFPHARFVLVRPSEGDSTLFQSFHERHPWIDVVTDDNYEIRRHLTLALSVSGTTALELTLLGIPMILFYKLSPLTYALAKCLIRIPYIGIPNILAGRAVVPEMIQADCTPEKLFNEASSLLKDDPKRLNIRESLLNLRGQLQNNGQQAVDVVLTELLSQKAD